MWKYEQGSGRLFNASGTPIAKGYSGHGEGLNNPEKQGERGVGPIPRGKWAIGAPYMSDTTGRYTMKLLAKDSTPGDDTHTPTGRGAFRMHGDNSRGDKSASHGCIIMPFDIRHTVWESGDHELEVV